LTATVEPADPFRAWLFDRIHEPRTRNPEPNLEP